MARCRHQHHQPSTPSTPSAAAPPLCTFSPHISRANISSAAAAAVGSFAPKDRVRGVSYTGHCCHILFNEQLLAKKKLFLAKYGLFSCNCCPLLHPLHPPPSCGDNLHIGTKKYFEQLNGRVNKFIKFFVVPGRHALVGLRRIDQRHGGSCWEEPTRPLLLLLEWHSSAWNAPQLSSRAEGKFLGTNINAIDLICRLLLLLLLRVEKVVVAVQQSG